MIVASQFLNIRDILQDQVTDFDLQREKPLVFKAGGVHVVCCPVRFYDHPEFVKDLVKILEKNFEIFQKVSFLSATNFDDFTAVQKAIHEITIFSDTKKYKKFITKDVPLFIQKWGRTIRKRDIKKYENNKIEKVEIIRIKKKGLKKFLKNFQVDELLHILMSIWVFNYDIVKKKSLSFIHVLNHGSLNIPESMNQHGSPNEQTRRAVMPKFSAKPYSKEVLATFEEQSKMN